ncbi:FMS1 involved in the biosynthesis of pantothenic acid [Fusarium denticulatum]|uniref:FMS1 involved in the biosynthesis of pantothenic acid n=1 Tax=Fusarium denticulatum TaxID=48507 RepID=A0A8H5XAD7_9HYPO|nr:FMS1 involved in the biosynthesis of pantothenic acid [Fusarium denticulatum]
MATTFIPSPLEKPSNCGSNFESLLQRAVITGADEKARMRGDNPLPSLEPPKKVIVVGAGISGLRAASVLRRHGLDVVIVEARDRIGGRICASSQPGKTRDLGAAWMHETSQNKLTKLIPKLGVDYYYDDGAPLYYTPYGKAGAQFKAKKVADEFADYCEWFYKNNPDAEDKSVDELVRSFVKKHDLITEDERLWAPQATREIELWIGTSTSVASSKHLSYFVTERNLYVLHGGYQKIIGWTAESILDSIHLNHHVSHVQWSEDGASRAVVTCQNAQGKEERLVADAVVVTVPLGVLRRQLISFSPALPSDISEGISRFSYGALGKVFFEFAEVFWTKDHDQLIYYPAPPEHQEEGLVTDGILAHPTVTVNTWLMSGKKELCIQVAEPLTQRVEAMSNEELYGFFRPLFNLYRTEPYKALPQLVSIECTKWTQDPLAGFGTYSADKVGDEPSLFTDALTNHKHSRLQFAGEHCTLVANGCVHGAFATGETAATNLLSSFGIEYDGGDLASSPQFCWGAFKKHKTNYDNDELLITHSTIDSWKAATKGRYTGSDKRNLIVRALSRDTATQGKTLGHAVKTASWECCSDDWKGHVENFNETVLALAGPLSSRFYGPLVVFAYNVDSQFHFESMDHISAADFGALVDVFHNSDWNPILGRVERYHGKTLSAVFLPDTFNFHRMGSPYTGTMSESPDELSIRRIIGTQDTVVAVNITAALDSKQLCWHKSCILDTLSIKHLCLRGPTFHALLLGPLLLDLPWIGRNAYVTTAHRSPPKYRWQESRSRFLRRSVVLDCKLLGIEHVPQSDGIIVFNAFGAKISPLHLIAYDEFMFRQLHTHKSQQQLSKLGFLSFWSDLKSGKVKITNELKKPQYSQLRFLEFWDDSEVSETNTMNQIELDFSEESCPYDCPADVKPILTEDESQVFLYVRKLFRDPDFVRANQRDWLEILHDANVVVQDRALGTAYWDDALDKLFTDHLTSLKRE